MLYVQCKACKEEMRHYEISKEMSSLYFGLDVFCLFETRVPEFTHIPVSLGIDPGC